MNDDVPARDVEGQTSFYAEKTAQSLYAQLGLRQAMASSHIVPKQLDEEIPRDNNYNQEFETQDQGFPVVKLPERLTYLFRHETEKAAMARQSEQSTKVIREKSVAVMDCGASQTITGSLINCKDVMEKVTIIETANGEENMVSTHVCTKTNFVRGFDYNHRNSIVREGIATRPTWRKICEPRKYPSNIGLRSRYLRVISFG